MKYSEQQIRHYVAVCFLDAFMAENREYNDTLWKFEWVMIKNEKGIYQLYPIIMQCKFQRVLRRVETRLKNNLFKNFGIQYKDTGFMICIFCEDASIDFNFTQALFAVQNQKLSMSVLDGKTNPYKNNLSGKSRVGYPYEKLVLEYWGLTVNEYYELPKNDEKRNLPNYFKYNWEKFKELYKRAFNVAIGEGYDIIYSSGVKRL